jgi:hypothetical protein
MFFINLTVYPDDLTLFFVVLTVVTLDFFVIVDSSAFKFFIVVAKIDFVVGGFVAGGACVVVDSFFVVIRASANELVVVSGADVVVAGIFTSVVIEAEFFTFFLANFKVFGSLIVSSFLACTVLIPFELVVASFIGPMSIFLSNIFKINSN